MLSMDTNGGSSNPGGGGVFWAAHIEEINIIKNECLFFIRD